jgi:formylglycine-generating enzyme
MPEYIITAILMALSCPDGMVKVPKMNTCIDKYEWPNIKGQKPEFGLSGEPSTWDKQKGLVKNIRQLCESVGKRPCSMNEWINSCRGPRGSDYPWGHRIPGTFGLTPDKAKCNYAQPFTDPIEMKIWARDPKEFARLDKRDKSGTRGCVSASGAEDMTGNLEEWVTCPKYMSKNNWCLVGRYWSELRRCNQVVTNHDPTWFGYSTGGRCCLPLTW